MTQFYQCLIFYIKSKKFITAEYPSWRISTGYSSSRIFIHPTMFLHCSLVICSWTSCSTMLLSASQCINLVLYDISSWACSFSIFNAHFHFHTCFVYAARSADEADQSKQSNLSFSRTMLHSASQTRAHTTQMNIPCLTQKIC